MRKTLRLGWAFAGSLALTAVLFALASPAALAGGVDVTGCGLAHHGQREWTVQTVLSTSEDGHPDLSCATARATVAAIDGGKGAGDKRESSPGSGQAEVVYGAWVCTITNGWDGGAHSTFMARRVHGQPTWVSCSDGHDVSGEDDSIAYSYGKVSLL